MNLYFITGNKGKLTEMQAIIPELKHLDIDLPELQEIDPKKIISAKLHEAFKHHSGQFIVEDTSLYLECLNGLPGPLIKWFLKTVGLDGLYKIAESFKNTKAVAKTIIGFAASENQIHFFEGEISGEIVKPRGTNGFGWNPVFQPNDSTQTFAEMELAVKRKYSMREIAAQKLKDFIRN